MSTAISQATAAPKPRRRRWPLVLVAFIAASVLGVYAVKLFFDWRLEVEWAAAEAEADRLDPGWRYKEMVATFERVPDNENAALLIRELTKDESRDFGVLTAKIFKYPTTARFNDELAKEVEALWAKYRHQIEPGRKLKDMPNGRLIVDDPTDRSVTPWASRLLMADWLQYDALASAQRGQPTLAAESCLAIVNVGRANRDLLGFMYLLVQNNNHLIVTVTLERVLAQGVVDEPTLTKLQKALETEAQENVFLAAARGERAFAHILLQHFKAGKRVEHKLHTNVGGLRGRLLDYFPDTVIRYYPERLHQMNRLVEIAKLPMHERIPELTKHTAELRAAANPLSDVRFINYHQEDLDRQCWLHSTIAAIACERYRLAHNNWPNDLNVVVKEKYLSPMPLDPVDGEPLRFTAKADGIVVYSVGRNGKDDGGAISRHGGVGDDQGFRLWDERFRGGPPVPIVEGKKKK